MGYKATIRVARDWRRRGKKRAGRNPPGPDSKQSCFEPLSLQQELKAYPQPELHLPRRVSLTCSDPEVARRSTEVKSAVGHLVVVEDVHEDGLEFRAELLRDLDVFLDFHIHVPVGQAANHAYAR